MDSDAPDQGAADVELAAATAAADPARQAGFLRNRPRRGQGAADRLGTIIGIIGGLGICVAGAVALLAVLPSSALWMGLIVCHSPYKLTYAAAHYSYKPGQSGTGTSYQCVSGASSYDANAFAIDGIQSLVIASMLAVFAVVAVLFSGAGTGQRRVARTTPRCDSQTRSFSVLFRVHRFASAANRLVLGADRNSLLRGLAGRLTTIGGFGLRTSQELLGQVAADPGGRRVVEDHRGRQGQPGRGLEAVT